MPQESVPAIAMQTRVEVTTFTTILLISAIANIIVGLCWFMTFAGIIVAVPLWVLCVFEFKYRAKLISSPDPRRLCDAMLTLGILEIVAGLFNWVTLVCGILVLAHRYRLRA